MSVTRRTIGFRSDAGPRGTPRFSNEPCAPCGRDTLHLAGKCQTCGHINRTERWPQKAGYGRSGFQTPEAAAAHAAAEAKRKALWAERRLRSVNRARGGK